MEEADARQEYDGEGFGNFLREFVKKDITNMPLTGLVQTIVNLELVKNTSTHPLAKVMRGSDPDYESHAAILQRTLGLLYAEVERREKGF
ncbi:MAG: hypothetical protein Q8L34_00160 [Candidatus Woesearchaeota archaeon]|nr:hypothetical protein [Candidatus Woesearchaeota archaeon]